MSDTLSLIKTYHMSVDHNIARSPTSRWRALMESSVKDGWNLSRMISCYRETLELAVADLVDMENAAVEERKKAKAEQLGFIPVQVEAKTETPTEPEARKAKFIYVARNATGAHRGYVFDDPGYEKSTAKSVAKWIRDGCNIERHEVTSETLRSLKEDFYKQLADGNV